jgi:hypothetical protein
MQSHTKWTVAIEPTMLVQERLLSLPVDVKTLWSVLEGDTEIAGTGDWTEKQTGLGNGPVGTGEWIR